MLLPKGPLDRSPSQGGFVKKALILLLFALLALGVAIRLGAGSMSKEGVREGILGIAKNAPFAAAVQRVNLAGDVDSPAFAAHFPGADADAPPLVFVHGTPDTMGAFEALIFGAGELHGKASIWTLEVCGHGIAPAADEAYPFQRCADYVAKTILALGLEGVTLVGNSYGAEFCWRAAVDHPELISRLVLIDSSGLPRTAEQFLSEEVKMREWRVARLGYLANSEARVAYALDPHFDGAADEGRVHEVYLSLENAANWNAMIDLVKDESGEREMDLVRVQAKTLLIWGEHDEAYAPETFGRTFQQRIPDARLVVVEGAGHYPHEQEPALVAKEILEFHLAGVEEDSEK